MQTVKEMMSTGTQTCQLTDPVRWVVGLMKRVDCGAIPVLDEGGRVINIITDRDIAMCMNNPSHPLEHITVRECVGDRRTVVSVMPDDDIHRAIDLMEEYQVRRLVVIDVDRRCVGMLSQGDIARKDINTHEVGELVREVSR